ncbi:MAG: signal peptidase I [Ruminococcaceae bacterium]|nr:signal peptidase I [Oscillospiraceae bacterium]
MFRKQAAHEPEEKEGLAHNLYYWLQTLVVAVVAIVLLFGFVCRITRVEGDSMLDTLHQDDLLLLWSLGYTPKAGDVVVLNKTGGENTLLQDEAIVKRVIATGGQTVEIDYTADTVCVDGQLLDEPYIRDRDMNGVGTQTYEVPEGHVFVMGDNRNHSTDGRAIGPVSSDYVIGRVVCVLFPFSNFGFV